MIHERSTVQSDGPGDPVFILGTGVLAEEFHALLTHAGWGVSGFVENLDPQKADSLLCGLPILWVDDLPEGSRCVCALSTTHREKFVQQVADRATFPVFVHPSSVILPGTILGAGTIISTGVQVGSHTVVGHHVFINRGARIGHHTRINDFVTIQPSSTIAGLVEIGRSTYVGMGAIIIERLKVGPSSTVAAGAVVIKDVGDHVLVAGNPAVVKKEKIDAR